MAFLRQEKDRVRVEDWSAEHVERRAREEIIKKLEAEKLVHENEIKSIDERIKTIKSQFGYNLPHMAELKRVITNREMVNVDFPKTLVSMMLFYAKSDRDDSRIAPLEKDRQIHVSAIAELERQQGICRNQIVAKEEAKKAEQTARFRP